MAIITYEDVIPTPIANTTIQKRLADGVHRQYVVAPIDGYVLHDNRGCWTTIDENMGEEVTLHAFYSGNCTTGATYDFVANPYEFYAVPETEAPADQIFGGGANNNHETM